MNIILFGAPGVGKGTQAVNLVSKYHLVHISTGEMFREAIKSNSPLGQLANSYISKGNLVPDEVTISIVKERISQSDCQNGFILDGFPRTLHQAECLEQITLELNMKIDYVIDIEVSEAELVARLSGRRVCKKCGNSYHVIFNKPKVDDVCDNCQSPLITRDDDNQGSVLVRLQNYNLQTKPLIDYYQNKGLLVEINGQQAIDDVFKEIVNKIGE